MGGRLARALVAAISMALAVVDSRTALRAQTTAAPCGLELRVLVLSADGGEAVLPAITQALDYIGTPYRTYIARQTPGGLTPAFLADGCHANFNAIIQTTGDLATETSSGWSSALTADETQALHAFEAQFGTRQVNWFLFPTPDFGFDWGTPIETSDSPLSATLTPAGRAVFPYLQPSATFEIADAYAYLARPFSTPTTPF